jgi:SAM-dependent methyltransferase
VSHFRDAALQAIRDLPDFRSLSYLELGCGDGFILEKLHEEKVKAARGTTYRDRRVDYIRSRDYPEHLQVDGGIDLNRPLPYADGEFDVVYSTEVIEHVESHRNFLTQAARVLKPGGWLVLTSPNVHRILSRINFALSGVHLTKQALVPWTAPLERMEEFHHRCVDFPLLHWLLWKGGLRVQEIRPTDIYLSSRLALVMWPIAYVMTRVNVMRHTGQDREEQQARRDLLRWMMSAALLSSEQFCIVARKSAG